MVTVSTRKDLCERLKDIRAAEILARDGYKEDTITFTNFLITQKIEKIKKDEDHHIKMLDKLIEMLSK
jgi:rubrerythrin